MKVTVERTGAAQIQPPPKPPPPSDLPHRPSFPRRTPRRRLKAPGAGVRIRREPGAPPAKRGSRPETPLLRWKFDEGRGDDFTAAEEDKSGTEAGRKCRRRIKTEVSARKLAAGLWRLYTPEFQINFGQRVGGFQSSGVGHFGGSFHCHHVHRVHGSPAKDLMHSPRSMSGPKHELFFNKLDPSFQFPNPEMEGATKWDPHGWKASNESNAQIFARPKTPQRNRSGPTTTAIPALEAELDRARARIDELESERRSSKKKLEQFLRKLGEERAAWRSREHEKVRAIMDDMKSELARERKNRQRLESVNSKLVNELADARLSAKHLMQEYEKERKDRTLIEEVCDELAKEISEDKAEVEALKRECTRLREEVEEERRMLQMAEVWREERVQMKLVDAKVMLEEKYAEMNALVASLESFLSSSPQEIEKAEFLVQVAKSLSMQDVRDLTYEPPNTDDIFSVLEDGNFNGLGSREDGTCGGEYSPISRASKIHTVSPEVKVLANESGGLLEEDASEWETVSHPEDQGSSYSPEGSDPSVNSRNFRASSSSRNGAEWEKDGAGRILEIREVDSAQMRQIKRASSISKLWRSCPNNGDGCDGKNGKPSNGRISNGTVFSPNNGLGLSPQDFSGQWSSPDSGNPHINHRTMKGCIEWPRGAHKSSLKTRLLEARLESQKVQLRQVLKQKI
ncbi:Unknown protein [Striga hermonthica]|uniref:Uncharacterized protein n=1 Tax=Striga hermonthica TaxID=68872 RepID=A0A9N7R3Y5_STRHE|nr:Unknown protein [Striga hermonthica]